MSQQSILEEIAGERARQDAKWGANDGVRMPSVLAPEDGFVEWLYGVPLERTAKALCDAAFERGECTHAHVAVEELCEVIAAPDDVARRGELVQLAAVCVKWLEAIDRRAKKA